MVWKKHQGFKKNNKGCGQSKQQTDKTKRGQKLEKTTCENYRMGGEKIKRVGKTKKEEKDEWAVGTTKSVEEEERNCEHKLLEIVESVVSLWCHDHDHSRDICSRLVHEKEVSSVIAQ